MRQSCGFALSVLYGLMGTKKIKLVFLVSVSTLTACATNIAKFTPIDIASNSVRRTDALSGVSEVLAPRVVSVLGRQARIKGQAQLRTAGSFIDNESKVHEGGAYLDVTLSYGSATPDPAEARIYDQANWPGGEPALLVDFGATVLDCREDIRVAPKYQYTPIYGAWGYGHIHDDSCGHEYGLSGWGRGYGHYGHGHVHDDDCGHDVGTGGGNTVVISPTTDPRPVGRPVSRPDRPRRPRIPRLGGVVPQPDDLTDPDVRPRRPRRPNTVPMPKPGAVARPPKKIVSRPRPDIQSTKPAAKVVSKPKPVPVSKPRTTYDPKPNVSKPRASKPRNKPKPRAIPQNKFPRQMNYYPRDLYYRGTSDYVVRRRCGRQEHLRIFVPRERLDATETNGLVLYLRPRGGQEEVLSLPPNYITGFKLAAWSPQGPQLTIQGKPLEPIQAAQAPTIEPDEMSEPSSYEPIIYGGN